MISRTRATVSSVWEVEGLPGLGSSSKDRSPLLKREYYSNVFDRLRQDSPKDACSISYLSATHTLVDVHPRASTERIRGDNDLRFCTYTCRELPRVPICCHFATFYSFPGNKSVPELNDKPRYIGIFLTCGEISKFVSAFAVAESVSYSLHYTLQLCTYKYLGQRWRSVPGYLWGNSGSVTACNRKRDLKINKCPVEVFNCNCRVFIWQKDVKTKKELTMCYCDVPIEFFFQIEVSWLHRNGKSEQDCELELI